jgi:membrane fusion protein (multidrug efflux system)
MPKWLIILIIVIIFVIAVAVRIVFSNRDTRGEEVEQAVAVEVMSAEKGDVISTCEVLGTIMADKTAPVLPETMGRITRILVKEGSYVKKNTKIMALRNETIGFEYEEGYIRAPISGNIAKIMVDVGAMVTPQSPVAMVVDYARVKVAFNVSETEAGCISKKKKVFIETDALPDESFKAQISEISPVIDPMTHTIAVKAVINNNRKQLKPGMTARVKISLGEKINVVRIPRDAFLDGYLFVAEDSIAERRDVEVGLIGDKNVEILAGIQEGEHVIIVGQQRLAGGEKINVLIRGE